MTEITPACAASPPADWPRSGAVEPPRVTMQPAPAYTFAAPWLTISQIAPVPTTGSPYDLAAQQSKIPCPSQRKREIGLPSFGEKLKTEREKRKISLEQISSSTKIGTRMLQALEEDKFNQLPGGIFNKGFVRAYARFVGLDEDQAVAEYLQASGDAPLVRNEPGGHEAASPEERARENQQNIHRLEAISDAPTRSLPWGLFAALLLVVALALSFWNHRQRERARLAVPPASTMTAAPSSSGASAASSEADGTNPPASNSAATTRPTANSLTTASTNSPPPGQAAPSVAPKTSPDSTAAPLPGEFTVVILVREESWISISADGKTTASELLEAGSERTVRGRKEVIVKAGNAGGVTFQFNGKKLETGGDYGEVKTVTFGPDGLLPTAPPPSTP